MAPKTQGVLLHPILRQNILSLYDNEYAEKNSLKDLSTDNVQNEARSILLRTQKQKQFNHQILPRQEGCYT